MTAEETTIALLEIQQQIARCGAHWLTRNTLRQKAAALAAQFVDPSYELPSAPELQNSTAMAADVDPSCGF